MSTFDERNPNHHNDNLNHTDEVIYQATREDIPQKQEIRNSIKSYESENNEIQQILKRAGLKYT